jgi:hypothetical protein
VNRKLRIAIFARTSWSEFPRLRHQVTQLLVSNGHHVTFFEKPDGQTGDERKISDRLTIVPMPEFIHHQLRPFRFISNGVNRFAERLIQKYFHLDGEPDLIINFNYYFYFLKKLFPHIPVISIINDDFEAQGKWWMKKNIGFQVEDTCRSSDAVLTVSYPLLTKLSEFNQETFLFFPWAQNKYSPPPITPGRNAILYFGHINHRLDFELMNEIAASGLPFRLIGPVERRVDKTAFRKFLLHNNVTLLPPCPLGELDFSDVCCSVLPYDLRVKSVNACSVSNRSFNLLSRGIPLIAPAMPGGIKISDDVISYCRKEEFRGCIHYFRNHFYEVQKKIEEALDGNYAADRYALLENLFERFISTAETDEQRNTREKEFVPDEIIF